MSEREHGMAKKGTRYWFGVLKATIHLWLDAQSFAQAAALAFYTIFSVAPLMIIAVTIIGVALGEQAAQGQLAQKLQELIGANAASAVQAAVDGSRIENSGILPTAAGIGAILIGATAIFVQLQTSLNTIWGVIPKPSRSTLYLYLKARLLSLVVVFGMSFVMLASLLLSIVVQAVALFAQEWVPIPNRLLLGLDWGASLMVVTLLFAIIFRVLPDVVLEWRDVWLGAFVTGLLFSFGRGLIAYYLSTTATASVYGAAGSLVLLLMWVNYSSLILLLGAAFTRASVQARGLPVHPRSTAVRVRQEIMDDAA